MDTYYYVTELETFTQAAAASVAFNNPKDVEKLRPGYGEVDLEDVHPMLRPVRTENRG